MTRMIALLAASAAFVGLAAGAFVVWRGPGDDPFAPCRRTAVAGEAAIGGPFELSDPTGRRLTDSNVIDGPTLVYFGYSFCPDVCPLDLVRNAAAADVLADGGVDVGQVFITVDPERDTPEALGDFAGAIHPQLIGLTGTEAEVAAAADAYRVYYRRGAGDDAFYTVDHSTFTYLMAPGNRLLEFFPSDRSPEQVADAVACYAARL